MPLGKMTRVDASRMSDEGVCCLEEWWWVPLETSIRILGAVKNKRQNEDAARESGCSSKERQSANAKLK